MGFISNSVQYDSVLFQFKFKLICYQLKFSSELTPSLLTIYSEVPDYKEISYIKNILGPPPPLPPNYRCWDVQNVNQSRRDCTVCVTRRGSVTHNDWPHSEQHQQRRLLCSPGQSSCNTGWQILHISDRRVPGVRGQNPVCLGSVVRNPSWANPSQK